MFLFNTLFTIKETPVVAALATVGTVDIFVIFKTSTGFDVSFIPC
jgi:hypothetical protein